jgi:hypothetical protein
MARELEDIEKEVNKYIKVEELQLNQSLDILNQIIECKEIILKGL